MQGRWAAFLLVLLLTLGVRAGVAASEYHGKVTLAGVPIPGATVTATLGDKTFTTITDKEGIYRFPALTDGVWQVKVAMVGFETATREVTIPPPAEGAPPVSELVLLPIEKIVGQLPAPRPLSATTPAVGAQAARTPVVQQTARVNQVAAPPPAPANEEQPADPTGMGAAAGLLINGSVNNGASTPFAQARAFGTNRPNQRSLYTTSVGVLLGNSSWDARPFSLTGANAVRPSYTDAQVIGTFQGPFRIPGLRNQLSIQVQYRGSSDHTTTTQLAFVPTPLERAGDFSQSVNAAGGAIRVIDPQTGLPFDGNRIPRERISPQAAALLGYFPLPDSATAGRFNYQASVLNATRQDNVVARIGPYALNNRHTLQGQVGYQRGSNASTSLLGFENVRDNSGFDTLVNWNYRLSQFMTLRARYQVAQGQNENLPFFANRVNVSGEAGITGNNQDPLNWGPPDLVFASDIVALRDGRYALNKTRTQTWGADGNWFRGRQNIAFGAEVRKHDLDTFSQQDPRGSFTFTGAASGSDFGDFLLGLPQTSAIAFGNADKYFRNNSYAAYLTDDVRLSPSFTLNLGVRWEYEAPITERFGRLVNLDVAPDFTAVTPVIASEATGALTAAQYPSSLVRPDLSGIQPRLGIAWRPIPGSSLVVRAGYGIYRNTNVYQSIANVLAQQPPLSTSFSVATSASNPLTLANGFSAVSANALNTFAVDPDFRVGFAQNWQASIQRDLPASLTVAVTYLGSKGSRLMQQFVPNTYPVGAVNPCPTCPSGFRYLISDGRSIRNAGQVQLRRRLRNGLSASVQYTLAKAMDNAAAFGGASVDSGALAQNWLDLEAEYARSSFDQRHQVVAQVEYTTGAGVVGGTLLDGWKGRLFKDWTVTGQLTTGSGTPLTPTFFSPLRGTGIIGGTRPSLTGAPIDEAPDGYYANADAFTAPAPGEWGTAARNSITGPSQFSFNAAVARTFRLRDRITLDWRIDAMNVLNRLTYSTINTQINSGQFGLPRSTNDARKLRSSIRVGF